MLGRLFQGVIGCLSRVRSRPILCVSVRSCASPSRCGVSAGGSFPVPLVSSVWLCGGVAVACSPVPVVAGGAGDVVRLVPFPLIACSLRGAGRLDVGCFLLA